MVLFSMHAEDVSSFYINEFIINNKGQYYELLLPYRVERSVKRVFKYDSPLILDVKCIEIDGIELLPENDPALFEIPHHIVQENKKKDEFIKYVQMLLKKLPDGKLSWSLEKKNLRYIFPIEADVSITYRVLLPFPFASVKRILRNDFNEKYYSSYNKIVINIGKSFKESEPSP
jgi:hypothetical protein